MLETPSNFTFKNPFSVVYDGGKTDATLLNDKPVAVKMDAVRTSKDGVEDFVPLGGVQVSAFALWLQTKLN
eukprot:CAMPEP_0178594344 /NCGR_PEP_ID=MMETSP0697-20121206/30454_1 /TAXON_ID=265572 /ORGANISM="Extubocellulus spinifer, Strain CCMP396" /LENGTH=70 /DNA_ID=CAMNT_0020231629 /DNA_START=97 /DNA_END=309 /DNA_ORIENTATION=+